MFNVVYLDTTDAQSFEYGDFGGGAKKIIKDSLYTWIATHNSLLFSSFLTF